SRLKTRTESVRVMTVCHSRPRLFLLLTPTARPPVGRLRALGATEQNKRVRGLPPSRESSENTPSDRAHCRRKESEQGKCQDENSVSKLDSFWLNSSESSWAKRSRMAIALGFASALEAA